MSAPDKNGASKEAETLIAAIVAHGRTVTVPGKKSGPGDTVKLPQGEVDRLRRLGYLVDEKAAAPMVGNGPTFSTNDGPSVKAA